MNLIIIRPADFTAAATVMLSDYRAEHIRNILSGKPGDRVRVGILNGKTGSGVITAANPQNITLQVICEEEPPPPLPLHLICAMQRPKTLRKILQCTSSMGVKRITVIECWKVDKSYWSNPLCRQPAELEQELLLGLEQGRDTMMPQVEFKRRFKPFAEDELPGLLSGAIGLVAHPEAVTPCPAQSSGKVVLALGPEGGFTEYEIGKFVEAGMQPVNLGMRILRTEFAVPALLGRLF